MRHLGILALPPAAALVLLGCGTNPSTTPDSKTKAAIAKEKIMDAVEATGEAAKEKQDEFVRAMSMQLDELNLKYEKLQGRAAKAGDQTKKDLEKKLAEAKVKLDEAARKLDELKAASADRWEKVKEGVGNALDDLKKAFE